ncbi:hypothetical protein Ahy_B05g079052 [Arachis hypogaea]|uniref:Aminotransferase-like plant mobile domain-containing protein n=1 Tax=Arachis hypogaea TaxID=3818 RepID=A0A444Z8W4_ARAHY|nr:hypothetical protein Ahy_B05g079052 [Arachis hypogaea]
MAASSSHAAAQDKGKGPSVEPPALPALHALNQVNDKVIDNPELQTDDTRILIPFTIGGDVHYFIGPIETLERANKKLPFFHLASTPCPYKERRLGGFGDSGTPKAFPLFTFNAPLDDWSYNLFWNRTTNNFHLPCGMIGMSLLDVAAITGLPINPPDCTSDMQPRHQYNIVYTNSYSEFIAHNMGAEGTAVADEEHVSFLFYWLNAIIFCSRSVQMLKFFLPLAALLHEANTLNLAKLLLGHVFEEIGQFVHCLRDNCLISTGGPL